MNTFISYDVGTVEKSTGHSYIFFIADEVIGIPPLFIPFWPCREQGLFLYMIQQLILAQSFRIKHACMFFLNIVLERSADA